MTTPPVDALVIAVVVVLNAVLRYAQQARAERAVAALQQMTAVTSSVVRGGDVIRVPSVELVRAALITASAGAFARHSVNVRESFDDHEILRHLSVLMATLSHAAR